MLRLFQADQWANSDRHRHIPAIFSWPESSLTRGYTKSVLHILRNPIVPVSTDGSPSAYPKLKGLPNPTDSEVWIEFFFSDDLNLPAWETNAETMSVTNRNCS